MIVISTIFNHLHSTTLCTTFDKPRMWCFLRFFDIHPPVVTPYCLPHCDFSISKCKNPFASLVYSFFLDWSAHRFYVKCTLPVHHFSVVFLLKWFLSCLLANNFLFICLKNFGRLSFLTPHCLFIGVLKTLGKVFVFLSWQFMHNSLFCNTSAEIIAYTSALFNASVTYSLAVVQTVVLM